MRPKVIRRKCCPKCRCDTLYCFPDKDFWECQSIFCDFKKEYVECGGKHNGN